MSSPISEEAFDAAVETTSTAPPQAVPTAEPASPRPDAPVLEAADPEPEPSSEVAPADDTHERDEQGRFTGKKKASAKHAPEVRYAELTFKQREAERRAAAAEAERDALRAERDALKAATVAPSAPPARQAAPEPTIDGFTEPEPTVEDFATAGDPYAAYVRALAKWDRRKEAFEAETVRQEAQTQHDQAQLLTSYQDRATAFLAAQPDFNEAIANGPQEEMTPLLKAAIVGSDNGPAFVYYLASHPDVFYEMSFVTDGKPVTNAAVTTVQRLLDTRLAGATTGSPTPSILPSVPRPPNPVRTGPLKVADAAIDDASSVEEHIRHYNAEDAKKRLSRRA